MLDRTIGNRLGALAEPKSFNEPIALENRSTDELLHYLKVMLRIRYAEEAIADLYRAGEVACPCHLGIGQEAVAVGVSSALRETDRVYGGHRSHAHYLGLGASLERMIAEVFGKATGASRGMGGSMHLYAPEVGFHGSVPIVGATIPIAAGAALAAKMDGKGDVAVAYFGDGACEEGAFHETLNMAAVMELPVLFVVENNLYSSHLDIKLRQPFDSVTRFARASGIEAEVVDGNDVVAVASVADRLVQRAREGRGPGFLEAVTFRWRGHVGPNEDLDVGVRRSPEELAAWKGRDPVRRLWQSLISERGVPEGLFYEVEADLKREITLAIDQARVAPYPEQSKLLEFVYAPAEPAHA